MAQPNEARNDFLTKLLPRGGRKATSNVLKYFQRGFCVHQKEWKPERTFELFLKLPPEIRERIYEICCDNDRMILEQHFATSRPPPEPAVACTSRLLRREALPVFYRHYRFPVANNPGSLINKGSMPPCQEWRAARWYHRLDARKLSMIRKLELYYCFGQFYVDFDVRRNTYRVEQTAWGSQRLVDVHPIQERLQLLALVKSSLDDLVACPGVGAFTAHDFDRLELEVSIEKECA